MDQYHLVAPSDAEAAQAWDQCMEIARRAALVVTAAGGMVILATPENQRASGDRERTLRIHRMSAGPDDDRS